MARRDSPCRAEAKAARRTTRNAAQPRSVWSKWDMNDMITQIPGGNVRWCQAGSKGGGRGCASGLLPEVLESKDRSHILGTSDGGAKAASENSPTVKIVNSRAKNGRLG